MSFNSAFSVDDLDDAVSTYKELGFVILKNAVSSAELDTIESELKEAQDKLIAGELGDRPGVFRDLAGLGHLALQFEPKALHLIDGCKLARGTHFLG